MYPDPVILSENTGFVKYLLRVVAHGSMEGKNENDIAKAIFMNSVFQSGIDELFYKHYDELIMHDLKNVIYGFNIMKRNMYEICRILAKPDRKWRLLTGTSFEQDLACRKLYDVSGEVIGIIESGKDPIMRSDLRNGGIYYLGYHKNENEKKIVFVRYEINGSNYSEVIGFNGRDVHYYWKTDEAIRLVLEKHGVFGIGTCKVTLNKNTQKVIKCEFSGDISMGNILRKLFGDDCLLIPNPFVMMDDLVQISRREYSGPKEKQCSPEVYGDLINRNILIEYPQDSFMNAIKFLIESTRNPKVVSIYATLYRIGEDPKLFYALRSATVKGIKVHLNIEMFATGEGINSFWYQEFIKAGMHVTAYRAGDVKVHAKVILIEQDDGRSLVQIGTGNYHTKTTSQYTDLALNTTDEELCNQVRNLFHLFDGEEDIQFSDSLLVSQINMIPTLIKLIESEGRKKKNGCIIIKCNAIDDPEIIKALNKAAYQGCKIELIIRGNCSWYPDANVLNHNVRIRSFVWDKLEHSRVYSFGRRNPIMYVGSVDLVTRKLHERIEVLAKVSNIDIRKSLMEYIERYVNATKNSFIMTRGMKFPIYVKGDIE